MPWQWLYVPVAVMHALLAGGWIGLGLWGLLKKRPAIFSVHLFLQGVRLLRLSVLLFWGLVVFYRHVCCDFGLFSLQALLWHEYFLLLFIGFWRDPNGYLMLGVRRDTYYAAFFDALNQLQLKFTGPAHKVWLPAAEREVATRAEWPGILLLEAVRPPAVRQAPPPPPVLHEIALKIDAYYATTPVRPNYAAFIFAIALGVGILVFFGWLSAVILAGLM